MATIYSEFTTTGANLLVDLRTAILTSTDWSQPNVGSNPNLLKATTTRGAQMVIDINSLAPTNQRMVIGCYTSHDGTTGLDKTERYLWYKQNATGTFSALTFRVIVSASKEHVFFAVEGPRGGEGSADHATFGSMKNYFFMCDVVPYFTVEDTTPSVCIGSINQQGYAGMVDQSYMVYVSKSAQGTAAWNQGKLLTLQPATSDSIGTTFVPNMHGLDGSAYLSPYVVAEDDAGLRGRLNNIFFCGFNWSTYQDASIMQAGSTVEYGLKTYKIIGVNKGNGNNQWDAFGPLGAVVNRASGSIYRSPLVAVPMAD